MSKKLKHQEKKKNQNIGWDSDFMIVFWPTF